jgi:hypothetical protein
MTRQQIKVISKRKGYMMQALVITAFLKFETQVFSE